MMAEGDIDTVVSFTVVVETNINNAQTYTNGVQTNTNGVQTNTNGVQTNGVKDEDEPTEIYEEFTLTLSPEVAVNGKDVVIENGHYDSEGDNDENNLADIDSESDKSDIDDTDSDDYDENEYEIEELLRERRRRNIRRLYTLHEEDELDEDYDEGKHLLQ